MDSPLSTLGFVIFGITFSIYSVIAESQSPSTSALRPQPPLQPPPSHQRSPPPPPPPPVPSHAHPPHNHASAKPGPKLIRSPANSNSLHHRSAPRPTSHGMNGGKKIGLLFAGVAGIMQIGVVGFLVFKRRQLLRTKDAVEVGA